MKIVAVTRVQNESDIIESFCRYYSRFCEELFIVDNYSSDNTRNILKNLIAEGIPIYIGDEMLGKGKAFGTSQRNLMIQFAFDELNADLVLLPDADEFLFAMDGKDPRNLLEALDPCVEYQVGRREYVYSKDPDDNVVFLPLFFKEYRAEGYNKLKKAVISRYLFELGGQVIVGNHALCYPANLFVTPAIREPVELLFAHYPIRTGSQTLTKIIPTWIFHLCRPNRGMYGWNLKNVYDRIKEEGGITPEMTHEVSLGYGLQEGQRAAPIRTYQGRMPLDFCGDGISLRYTDYSLGSKNSLRVILTQIEKELSRVPEWAQKAELFDEAGLEIASYIEKYNAQQRENDTLQEHLRYYKAQCEETALLREHLSFYKKQYEEIPLLREHLEFYKCKYEELTCSEK